MNTAQFWYLPLAPAFFLILIALFFFIFVLLPLRLMKYAYEQLGVSPTAAVVLLFSSLIGSYINIPLVSGKLQVSAPGILLRPAVGVFGSLDFLRADEILKASEPIKEELKRRLGELLG